MQSSRVLRLVSLFAGSVLAVAPVSAATPVKGETTGGAMLEICIGEGSPNTTDIVKLRKEVGGWIDEMVGKGVTSHESYITWDWLEPEQGKWDFARSDALLDVGMQKGIRWVPFLIAGPAYSLPDWYYRGNDRHGYVCIEHGEKCDIESIWSPTLATHVVPVIDAFGRHFGKNKGLESILLGVTGNYGESIYPASGNDWTADRHGKYHTHGGWWCGDPDALADFQRYLRTKYADLKLLNDDWNTTYPTWSDIKPRVPEDWHTSAALQHQTTWYQESMTKWSGLWMRETKKWFPETDVYLVTGGHAPHYHGLDISAQTKLAAELKCGIRITNEADDYRANFVITRMVASACRLYGSFFSYEPAGPYTWKGIAARTFNASASGARCLHWYYDSFLLNKEIVEKWKECRPFARQREPVVDVAVFYPRRWMNIVENLNLFSMNDDCMALRNAFDYDFVDERMMADLAGRKQQPYRHLLVREDWLVDEEAKAAVRKWTARPGGPKLITFRSSDLRGEGNEAPLRVLSERLHPDDDFAASIYFARFKDGSVLFLNQRAEPTDLSKTHPQMVKSPLIIAPFGLAEIGGK